MPYLVGGSLASSLHGIPRATQDVDLVVEMGQDAVDGFVAALAGGFYVDEPMIREAIRRRSSFNVIELATMFKLDVQGPRLDRAYLRETAERMGVADLLRRAVEEADP